MNHRQGRRPGRPVGKGAGAPHRGAFSLVELLVVISIIAILVGLLFPVIAGVLALADTLKCQQQLKEIASAVISYTEGHGGAIPVAKYEPSNITWCNLLVRGGYLPAENTASLPIGTLTQRPSVLICPSHVDQRTLPTHTVAYPDDQYALGWYRAGSAGWFQVDCTYYWNGCTDRAHPDYREFPSLLVKDADTDKKTHVHNITEIRKRTTMAMLLDGVWMDGHKYPARIAARHRGDAGVRARTNIVYYDGHVDSFERFPLENWKDDPFMNRPGLSGAAPYFRIKDQMIAVTEEKK